MRVPASSANLGAGFDVLGMALDLHLWAGTGQPPGGARPVAETHPAAVAYRRAGGRGELWVDSSIPEGRGLGFSGAARVAGAAAAFVERLGPDALDQQRAPITSLAAQLEGHADNVAASVYGGIVAAVGDEVVELPLRLDPAVVVWLPHATTTSTDRSRRELPDHVSRDDAVFNLGRVAAFVAACATGDHRLLRLATDDRLHQPLRLAAVPAAAEAIDAALAAGAWAAWLSGSGPTVAVLCEESHAASIAAELPADGQARLVSIDRQGLVVDERE